jgi:hypothetical protein
MTEDKDIPNIELGIRLRYVGRRFDRARLPLEVLADLPAFRDLLVAYAKQEWRKVNSGRQRVPKGFDKSLSFDLTAIEDGSAVPQLQWDRVAAQSYLPGFASELEEIVDLSFSNVVRLIDDAGRGKFPKVLASEHVRALNKFGSTLRDDERIEFLGRQGRDGNVVYLDGARRKSLITKVRETYESRFEGTGTLVGIFANDDPQGYIEVNTDCHGLIKIPLDRERVVTDFDGNIRSLVQFDLQIELDNADKFRSLVEVHALVLIDERIEADLDRCKNRLNDIKNLNDGWDDDGGRAINPSAVDSASSFLVRRPHFCSAYRIFPTAVGGVLFEFESNGWDLSLEFAPGGSVEFFGIEIDGDGELQPASFHSVGDDLIAEFDRYAGPDGR